MSSPQPPVAGRPGGGPRGPEGDLRPPESWPGAGGRVSAAPPVPGWPGRRVTSGAGESWPGAGLHPVAPAAANGPGTAAGRLRPPAHHVDPRARGVWAVAAGLGWLGPVTAVVVWAVLDGAHRTAQGVTFVVVVLVALAHVVAMPRWRYRVHRWEVTEDAVYTQTGWFTQERRIAPIARVQTVDSERGPLERLFGLGTVTVTTASAAGPLRISGLPQSRVDQLVGELTRVAARHRGDAT